MLEEKKIYSEKFRRLLNEYREHYTVPTDTKPYQGQVEAILRDDMWKEMSNCLYVDFGNGDRRIVIAPLNNDLNSVQDDRYGGKFDFLCMGTTKKPHAIYFKMLFREMFTVSMDQHCSEITMDKECLDFMEFYRELFNKDVIAKYETAKCAEGVDNNEDLFLIIRSREMENEDGIKSLEPVYRHPLYMQLVDMFNYVVYKTLGAKFGFYNDENPTFVPEHDNTWQFADEMLIADGDDIEWSEDGREHLIHICNSLTLEQMNDCLFTKSGKYGAPLQKELYIPLKNVSSDKKINHILNFFNVRQTKAFVCNAHQLYNAY